MPELQGIARAAQCGDGAVSACGHRPRGGHGGLPLQRLALEIGLLAN
jgi:hypothetical protein